MFFNDDNFQRVFCDSIFALNSQFNTLALQLYKYIKSEDEFNAVKDKIVEWITFNSLSNTSHGAFAVSPNSFEQENKAQSTILRKEVKYITSTLKLRLMALINPVTTTTTPFGSLFLQSSPVTTVLSNNGESRKRSVDHIEHIDKTSFIDDQTSIIHSSQSSNDSNVEEKECSQVTTSSNSSSYLVEEESIENEECDTIDESENDESASIYEDSEVDSTTASPKPKRNKIDNTLKTEKKYNILSGKSTESEDKKALLRSHYRRKARLTKRPLFSLFEYWEVQEVIELIVQAAFEYIDRNYSTRSSTLQNKGQISNDGRAFLYCLYSVSETISQYIKSGCSTSIKIKFNSRSKGYNPGRLKLFR